MYLFVLFYQPGKKTAQFFYPVGKKEWLARYMPGLNRVE